MSEGGYTPKTEDRNLYSEAEVNAVDEAILGYEDAIVRKKAGSRRHMIPKRRQKSFQSSRYFPCLPLMFFLTFDIIH